MAFWLANNPTQTNFSYGLALNSPNDASSSSNDAGVLHWLAPDENSYEGDITWKTLIASNSSSTVNADSFVEMDSWNFQGDNVNISAYTGLLTVVDPLFNDLVFPQNEARTICGPVSSLHLLEPNFLPGRWCHSGLLATGRNIRDYCVHIAL